MGRTKNHSSVADWFQQVVRIEIEWCASREAALWAEGAAIKSENPRHNIVRPGKFGIAARSPEMKEACNRVLEEAAALGIKLQKNLCLDALKQQLRLAKERRVEATVNFPLN
jgi:hypothetical protein